MVRFPRVHPLTGRLVRWPLCLLMNVVAGQGVRLIARLRSVGVATCVGARPWLLHPDEVAQSFAHGLLLATFAFSEHVTLYTCSASPLPPWMSILCPIGVFSHRALLTCGDLRAKYPARAPWDNFNKRLFVQCIRLQMGVEA